MTVDKWDQRQLCADGACTGVIGPEGTCKTCGRAAPNWGDERNRGLNLPPPDDEVAPAPAVDGGVADADADDGEYEDDEDDDGEYEDDEDDDEDVDGDDVVASARASVAPADDVWDDRELCSDGACIGVIGDDGRCKVCGKPGARPAVAQIIAPVDVITTDDAVVDTRAVVDTGAVKTDPLPAEPDGAPEVADREVEVKN